MESGKRGKGTGLNLILERTIDVSLLEMENEGRKRIKWVLS